MPSAADYRPGRVGEWLFWRLKIACDTELLDNLIANSERQPPSKHPQTLPFAWPPQTNTKQFFLKVFHRRRGLAQIKDLLRLSKACRFWRQGLALSAAGFNVPLAVAVGEKRRWGLSERSMVLTEKITGQPAPLFLSGLAYSSNNSAQIKMKRRAVAQLGQLVRRFHDLGFVHGDLVATNIFVAGESAAGPYFYLMDNDRTQRFPAWMTVKLRKRNLVQLNRLPLAHITLQDRMRFLHSYLGITQMAEADYRLARWLEARTRLRRKQCDGADPNIAFRSLMRWTPEISRTKDV